MDDCKLLKKEINGIRYVIDTQAWQYMIRTRELLMSCLQCRQMPICKTKAELRKYLLYDKTDEPRKP